MYVGTVYYAGPDGRLEDSIYGEDMVKVVKYVTKYASILSLHGVPVRGSIVEELDKYLDRGGNMKTNDTDPFDVLLDDSASEVMRSKFDLSDILGAFNPLREIFEPTTHSGASIAHIVSSTTQMASENPEVENKTYIVSFPARIVTIVEANKGIVTCHERGYVEKKRKR